MGITFSPVEDLKTWADELGFTADLLSDPDRATALAYGAADSADQERPKRISILVGADGNVIKLYEVSDAEAHPTDVLGDLSQLRT